MSSLLHQLLTISYLDKDNKILPPSINFRNLGLISDNKTDTTNTTTNTNIQTETKKDSDQ